MTHAPEEIEMVVDVVRAALIEAFDIGFEIIPPIRHHRPAPPMRLGLPEGLRGFADAIEHRLELLRGGFDIDVDRGHIDETPHGQAAWGRLGFLTNS